LRCRLVCSSGVGIPYLLAQLLDRHGIGFVEPQRHQTEVAHDHALVHNANGTVDIFVEVRPWHSEIDAAQFGHLRSDESEALDEHCCPSRGCFQPTADSHEIAERHLARNGNPAAIGGRPQEVSDHATSDG